MKKENILIFCAHSDDQIFGVGGTIAKYSKEGKNITVIIYSYGENTHPWLKRKITIEMRVKESKDAAKVVGYHENIFLGLDETKYAEQLKEKKIDKVIEKIISKKKPTKIFTHSIDDPHIDHRDVFYSVENALKNLKSKAELYTFDVWNPINFRQRDAPQLFVDISKTFKLKIKALKVFRSQKLSLISLLWSVYLRAMINGYHNKCKYAERFIKQK